MAAASQTRPPRPRQGYNAPASRLLFLVFILLFCLPPLVFVQNTPADAVANDNGNDGLVAASPILERRTGKQRGADMKAPSKFSTTEQAVGLDNPGNRRAFSGHIDRIPNGKFGGAGGAQRHTLVEKIQDPSLTTRQSTGHRMDNEMPYNGRAKLAVQKNTSGGARGNTVAQVSWPQDAKPGPRQIKAALKQSAQSGKQVNFNPTPKELQAYQHRQKMQQNKGTQSSLGKAWAEKQKSQEGIAQKAANMKLKEDRTARRQANSAYKQQQKNGKK
ncbi:hypothetical protein DFJ73DRAFT_866496 [Zopfochytrium polystomum]|nr:hypothetical protein DFJ73DRAFT_866496 [Zopfochytrium polystomum]